MTTTNEITATVEPKGSKFEHSVYFRGELVDRRTSVKRYAVIHVQRWAAVGDTSHDTETSTYSAPDYFAARYSMKPKAVGAPIEYGFCAGNVEIVAL